MPLRQCQVHDALTEFVDHLVGDGCLGAREHVEHYRPPHEAEEEARLYEPINGDRLSVRIVAKEALEADDGGDAALDLVAEAVRRPLALR